MSNIKLVHSGGNSVSLTTPTSNPSSNVTFKLPAADGSAGQILQTDGNGNLTFVDKPTPGITQVDQWRVTSSFDATDSDVTSNWARNSNDFTLIGSGMTESSGIFTFPATGIYKVDWVVNAFRMPSGATLRQIGGYIYTTTDNSSYNIRAKGSNSITTDNYATINSYQSLIFDVTNTSTHKVKFGVFAEAEMRYEGTSDKNTTHATFLRLGDT